MKNKLLIICILLLISASTFAQQPDPCSKENQRANIAEIFAKSEQIRANQSTARSEELAQQLVTEKNKSNSVEQRLNVSERNSESLASLNVSAQQKIVSAQQRIIDLEKLLFIRTSERDTALLKIHKANGRWFCEIFHVYCIKGKS